MNITNLTLLLQEARLLVAETSGREPRDDLNLLRLEAVLGKMSKELEIKHIYPQEK